MSEAWGLQCLRGDGPGVCVQMIPLRGAAGTSIGLCGIAEISKFCGKIKERVVRSFNLFHLIVVKLWEHRKSCLHLRRDRLFSISILHILLCFYYETTANEQRWDFKICPSEISSKYNWGAKQISDHNEHLLLHSNLQMRWEINIETSYFLYQGHCLILGGASLNAT